LLSVLVVQKLDAQGVKLSARELDELTKEILRGGKDTFLLTSEEPGNSRKVTLDFSSKDIKQIERKLSDFSENRLEEVIEKAVDEGSQKLLATLKTNWTDESRRERQDAAAFRERLYERCLLPLERLRMLLAIAREFGASINEKARQSTSVTARNHLIDVLSRSHARACQITEEILCLLQGGFADGAMARWRTLHEVAVVASFIAAQGEELAERYVLHEVVEAKRAAAEYQNCQQRLAGYDPIEERELKALQASYDDAIARFGKEFKGQYGWAAHQLKIAKPNFDDIERAVGIGHLRAHYRMASHNVHANPKGIFFKLGILGEQRVLLSGPSNAGLADPGHGAARSLAHISATVAMLEPSFDNSMVLNAMIPLTSEIGELFAKEDKRLTEDARRIPLG
jgi:hypothetical protein